ncbi:hypothetical protein BJ138DRAFT_1119440 [Hygrophoropsis aurantiaca]|uniref:Uncharacterized protein n=1 Tax=Hygrophoropsis aurantiaca TaxID=72124 RepID=A0ACB7ZUU0_9AGAM|nr:hypothetical protein BJ138DRAFT_1119440 [Hygrophoropsis aurantiaca]
MKAASTSFARTSSSCGDPDCIRTSASRSPAHFLPQFSSHRFILVSRSPYFHAQLVTWANTKSNSNSNELMTITLPSPPFTPASLHFTLGYIYTGTLHFSHRTYDLATALSILTASNYLSLHALHAEIQARVIGEMLHGLFHAHLEFGEYERVTGGRWGTGGCRCRQCARRIPRVLEFSIADDVKNAILERGARRALVGLYGEGWCNPEFATLPQKIRDSLLKGLGKRTTPTNVFSLLFAAQHALKKLDGMVDAWVDGVRECILSGRKGVDECLAAKAEECFEEAEWVTLLEGEGMGIGFGDVERVGWVMESIIRGLNEKCAAVVYQAISSILLRIGSSDPNSPSHHDADDPQPLLATTSPIRARVEEARTEVVRYLRKRWMGVRHEGGFEGLEGWAVKEIAGETEVSVEDLLLPAPTSTSASSTSTIKAKGKPRTSSHALRDLHDADSDTISVTSLRASVLNRSAHGGAKHARDGTVTGRDMNADTGSSGRIAGHGHGHGKSGLGKHVRSHSGTGTDVGTPSIRSVARSTISRGPVTPSRNDTRPDSKLTPDSASVRSTVTTTDTVRSTSTERGVRNDLSSSTRNDLSSSSRNDLSTGNRNDLSPSPSPSYTSNLTTHTTSMRTHGKGADKPSLSKLVTLSKQHTRVSTVRSSTASSHGPTLRIPSSSRPQSSLSSATSETSTFRTAQSEVATPTSSNGGGTPTSSNGTPRLSVAGGARPRRGSGASDLSTRTVGTARGRPSSVASTTSTAARSAVSRTSAAVTARSTATRSSLVGAARSTATRSRATPTRTVTPTKAGGITATRTSITPRSSASKRVDPQLGKISPASTRHSAGMKPAGQKQAQSTVTTESDSRNVDEKDVDMDKENIQVPSLQKADQQERETDAALDLEENGETTSMTGTPPTLTVRTSTDTLKTATTPLMGADAKPLPLPEPRGATLEIGIPCIISSKRKRFRAFARYIGEVEGEWGPWVGVEVPVGDGWTGDNLDGRQWNDGSWGGVRYFDISGSSGGSEWEYGGTDEARGGVPRRRKVDVDWVYGSGMGTVGKGNGALKREGDQLTVGTERTKRLRSVSPAVSDMSTSESRGLFVRPQQVLYVVDAVGSDL